MAKIELHKVAARDKLAPRRDPYFVRLEEGKHLGFRRMTASSAGDWSVRVRDPATGKQQYKPLGTFDYLPPSQRHDAAAKAAEAWIDHLARGGRPVSMTVAEACALYCTHIESIKGRSKADEQRARFRRWIDSDPLGSISMDALKRPHVRDWRARLEATTVGRGDDHLRSASSTNRDMTALKAALNFALGEGVVSSDFPWAVPLKPTPNADGRRELVLSMEQRRALIAAASPEAVLLVKALCLLPLRPGACAALKVSDWDRVQGVLRIRIDKANAGRSVALGADAAAVLTECAKDKLPAAPLFSRGDGKAWAKHQWNTAIKSAATAAGLDPTLCGYNLRHSTISDLIAAGVDPAAVAVMSGTSLVRIHKNYYHLRPGVAREALQKIAL